MWDARRPHFLLGFDPLLCSQRLTIPSNFIKHMEGKASGTTLLFGPSGNCWFVDLVLIDDVLFLNDGWADFVRDHLLEQGDFIVFRYDGDLHFMVQFFDRTMCEKEAAFTAECSQDLSRYDTDVLKKRDRERSSLLDTSMQSIPKKLRGSEMCCGSASEDNAEECMQQADCDMNLKNAVTVAVPLTMVPHDNPDPFVRNRTTKLDMLLSASEAERIARSFTSSFPYFLKAMKRFNISGSYTLNVPYQFATEHLPKCKVKIVLRNLKGEGWTVNSIPTTKVQTSHTFCGGWLSFVRDNNVDIGDICIFELVGKFELQVRILRVGKEGMDDCDVVEAHEGRNNVCTTSVKLSKRKSKKISEGGHCAKEPVFCIPPKNCFSEPGFDALGKQGAHTRGFMSMKSSPEEKIAAQYFISSFPHFLRVMKKFNVSGSYTLKVPYQFSMEHLPSCKTEIVLRNLEGKCWTVNSIPTIKVQTLHTLCGGWMAFVRDNDVQMGDICIFELVGKCEMRVHICGIGKKGLNYQNRRNLPMA